VSIPTDGRIILPAMQAAALASNVTTADRPLFKKDQDEQIESRE
jgi:hypothetical protein